MINRRSLALVAAIFALSGAAIAQTVGVYPEARLRPGKPVTAISISPFRDPVKVGTTVFVIVTLTNTSNDDIEIERFLTGADSSVEVRDLNGNLLPDTHFGYVHNGHVPQSQLDPSRFSTRDLEDSGVAVMVKAGQSTKWSIAVSKFYEMRQPGKYSVRIDRIDPGDLKTVEKSNTITITLTP
jgi:hypothetical protein